MAALLLMTNLARSSSKQQFKFDDPPMFRLGLQAVLGEAAKRPSILARKSQISKIAPHLYADTPWSTWRPEVEEDGINWVNLAILDLNKRTSGAGTKTRKTKQTKQIKFLSPGMMAKRLGLPQQTIVRALKDLRTTPAARLRRSLPAEYKEMVKQIHQKPDRMISRAAIRPSSSKSLWPKPASSKRQKEQAKSLITPSALLRTRLRAIALQTPALSKRRVAQSKSV
jgi:hypothetical protein